MHKECDLNHFPAGKPIIPLSKHHLEKHRNYIVLGVGFMHRHSIPSFCTGTHRSRFPENTGMESKWIFFP
jgi:hypothetical protein